MWQNLPPITRCCETASRENAKATLNKACAVLSERKELWCHMAVGVLGGKRGTLAILVYVLLGAVGVPVFAGFSGGIGALLGNAGGYIVGFIFSALVMWAFEHIFGRKPVVQIISMVVGLIVCYAFGTVWFMFAYTRSTGPVGLMAVLGWCVFPFIIPDLIKIALAYVLSGKVRKYAR